MRRVHDRLRPQLKRTRWLHHLAPSGQQKEKLQLRSLSLAHLKAQARIRPFPIAVDVPGQQISTQVPCVALSAALTSAIGFLEDS